MKNKLNEEGYALLMVMMLVLLFTTLGMGLLAMNINASKQFNIKEEQVKARHQAEMGVLHYQKELEAYFKVNKPTISNAVDFCNNITPSTVTVMSDNKKYTTTLLKNQCSISNGQLTMPLKSTGIAGQKGTELIEAKLYLSKPSVVPQKPTMPTLSEEVITTEPDCSNKGKGQDCNKTIEKFTNVDTMTLKKGDFLFKNHLIVGNLTVEGGNGANLTVERDLYIHNNLFVQNFACIAVQGNFTIHYDSATEQKNNKNNDKNNVNYFGNKTYLYIYGDVNLPEEPDFKNGNSGIYVNGDVYLKGIKVIPKPTWAETFSTANGHKGNDGKCTLPGENPANIKWSLNDKIDAEYK